MSKLPLTKGICIAAVAAAAISLSAAGSMAAGEKKGAKMAAKPAAPGFCTARVNVLKWGHMHWRTAGGAVLPTLAMCYEPNCPAKC